MMKEKNTTLEMKEKKKYVSPLIEVEIIEMEYGIAGGSAIIKPGDVNVSEEWDTDPEEGTTVDW
ncbi:hypothetical protein VO54_03667 [Elizabethkingia miricola]|nr:hypothetical protein VO54_03667 [Elizabethkingia miricola]